MSNKKFQILINPRKQMTRTEFLSRTAPSSIALDGMVSGGPFFNPETNHANFDHHDGVVREATMSTAMQVFIAIKGGLINRLMHAPGDIIGIYINDTDQDTALAVWLLLNYKLFEGVQSIPTINRLLALNDRLDITGGAFPMNLDDGLVRSYAWIFEPYTDLRKSGSLATANPQMLRDNLDATMTRITKYMMNEGEEVKPDTRHVILYDSPEFKIINEIGGPSARTFLFNQGMTAFVSLVACRADGRFVYSIGRISQYVDYPVLSLYGDLNQAEDLPEGEGWGISDIVGGSSRLHGSKLSWQTIQQIVTCRLKTDGIIK